MMKKYLLLFTLVCCFSVNSQNFKFGKVSKKEVKEQEHSLEKNAKAAVLYRETKTYYEYTSNAGFSLVTEFHERIKIYSKEGLGWATKTITHFKNPSKREEITNIKGITYNLEDGKLIEEKLKKSGIFEEDVDDYRLKTTLTMPSVKVGSVIEYSYTLRSPFISVLDDMPLQYDIPINKLEVMVAIPEYFIFVKHFNPKSPIDFSVGEEKEVRTLHLRGAVRYGALSSGTRSSFENDEIRFTQTKYNISKENIPSLKEENHVDYLHNYAANLKWELHYTKFPNSAIQNFAETWEHVSKSVYDEDGIARELKSDKFFKKDVDALLAIAKTPEEKIILLYKFVKSKVKWDGYSGYRPKNGVKKAYATGEGSVADINLLLISMLQYAGLDANPVLLSTPDNGIPLFPTRRGFNYLICHIAFPDGAILLDATDPVAAPGELPRRARNWQGRLIKNEGNSSWVSLMPAIQSSRISNINIKFNADFSLSGKSTNVFNGLFAKSFREHLAGMNEEQYLQLLEKGKGNIKISELKKENEKQIGQNIKETYSFELSNAVEVINEKVYFKPLLFLAMEENPFKADERIYPIFFDYPQTINKTVNIMLPQGYEVEHLPESSIIELNAGAGIYKFLVHQNGNFLRVESVFDCKNTVYAPKDYEALKTFFGQMQEKQNETIVLTKA